MGNQSWIRRNADVVALLVIVLVFGIGAQIGGAVGWPDRPGPFWNTPAAPGWRTLTPEAFPIPEGLPLKVWKLNAARSAFEAHEALWSGAVNARTQMCRAQSELRREALQARREAQRMRMEFRARVREQARELESRIREHRRILRERHRELYRQMRQPKSEPFY